MSNSNSGSNSHNKPNHQSNPPLMKSQLNTANGSVAEPGHKSRCYLCDTPKPEYSLTRSFSEPICRGCLNYEGPDRVEQLIAEARRFKTRQASPPSGGAPISGCSFNSPANNNIDTNNNQNNNNINHVYKTHAQPPPASHVGAKLDSLKTTLQSHNYHPIAGDKQAGGLPVSAGILGDAGSGGDKLRSMIAATDGRGAVKDIDGPIARKRDRPLTSRSPSPSTTLIWENHNGGTKHQQQHDMSIHHHSQAAPGARGGGTTHPPLPAELLRAASSKIEQRTHKTNTTTTTTSTTTNRDEPFSGGDTRFTHTPPIATGPAIKNPLSYPDCCKQGGPPADQRYTGAAEPATGQLSANQESVSSRGFRFEQTSSSPNALDGHQQQAAPVAQHQLSASAAAAQKGAAQQAHHTTSSGSMGHSKQLDGRIPRTKTSVTPTKSTPSSVGPSYQHHQQSHMLEAALDPYQAMMRAAAPLHPAVCSPADQLLRMHQQQFQLEDPAMFARELARLQSGGGAGGLLMGGSEDARQPKLGPFDDGTQPAPLHAHQAADDSVKSSVDSLHRLVQDPNALGLPGLSMYAADPALACALPPSYYAPRSPPLPLIGQQQTTEDSGRHSDTGAARNTGKQAAQAAARAAQAAISSSLYGHYPIAMAPYMTPNGPLFCATQYHPYHFHHHTASFQSSAYNNLLAPPVGGLVSTTGSHLGPGPGAQLGTAAAGSTAGLPAPVPTDKLGGMGAYGPLVSSNGSGSDNQPPDYNLRRMLTGEASGDNQLNSAACQQQQQQLQTTKTHSEPRSAMEPVAAPDNKDSRPVTPVKGDRGLVGKLATRCCVSADNKLERGAEKLKQSADSNRCISDMEDSSSSNMLVILDRDSDHKEHHTVDQQQQPQQMTTRGRKPIRTPDEVTGDVSSPQAKQRSDPSFHRASPPPAKRVPLGFTKGKPLLSSKSDRDGCAPMDRSNSNETVSPYGDSFDAANSRSPTLMGSGGGGAKPKSLATTFKQHVTRRSQVASGESALEVDNSNKLNLNSEPDVEVERELRHSGRKGAASDASNMNNTSLPKNAQDPTAAGAGSGASGTSHRSSQTNSHHSLKGRHASAQNNNNSSNNNNSNKAPPVYQNENSSDRSYPKRSSAEEQAPVSISSTTSHSSSRKSSHQMKQQQQQLQQQQQKQQQQQQHQQLIPPHQYSPLKCSTCRERLEDRHFVQCPSVMAHKFCFACSKVAIERQQLENKKLGNGFDRVFCPSGNRCFLATEHTPWTFMNSEIETIFRESSRQSSSASSEANSHGARSNSNSSSEIINSNNNNHQQQQQQNGHHDKSSSSHDDASDPIQRSVSLLSPGSVASIQKKYNEADSGVAEVCSTGAQTGKVS